MSRICTCLFFNSMLRHRALRNPKTLQRMKYYNLGKLQIAQTSLHSIMMVLLNSSSAYLFACAFYISWIPGSHTSRTKNQEKSGQSRALTWQFTADQLKTKWRRNAEPLAPRSLEKERGRFTSHKHEKILGIQTWDLWYLLKASGTFELYVQCVYTCVKRKHLCS